MPEIRPLGASGLSTPPLVLGGNVFGWTADESTSHAILERFIAGGGSMIDTADVYSLWVPGHKGGESESVIGRWLAARGRRDDVLIATKVGMLDGAGGKGLAPARIAAAVEASLNRLGTDSIDLYFAHRDDPDTPLDEVMAAFGELVAAGKVKALGASNYSAARLAEALAVADRIGVPRFTVVQPGFNLVARDEYEGGLQALCLREGLGVVPYFGLASGYLTGKYRSEADLGKSPRGARMKTYLAAMDGHAAGSGPAVLAAMDAVAVETGATLAQIALAWNAAQPGITAPIASATTLAQLDELLASLDCMLSADQLARLDAASRPAG